MKTDGNRSRRWLTLAAGPLAVLAAGGLVWQASYSAFSADTRNSGNSWTTGSVVLSDDDSGSARFAVSDMTPGETDTKCIKVTSQSNVPGVVKLYLLNALTANPGQLGDYVKIGVTIGNGGTFADCTGYTSTGTVMATQTLNTAIAAYTDYSNAAGSWSTVGNPAGESKTYQLTYTFDTSGLTQTQLDNLQGHSVGVDFEWEIQNS